MISTHTVERLVIYRRLLKRLEKNGERWVTSRKLALILSKSPAQVRKDLSLIGRMGKPGVGYNIPALREDLERLIGIDRSWGVALIGAGNLGRALFYYSGFRKEGFLFRAVFDADPERIGKKWEDVIIEDSSNIRSRLSEGDIHIAVIAVPASAVQGVADKLVSAGIREMLNFAPVNLRVPEDVHVRSADLAFELENLAFFLSSRDGGNPGTGDNKKNRKRV